MLILAKLEHDIGAAVLLNGVTVYHEDDDKGFRQEFSAQRVTERLAEALALPFAVVVLTVEAAGGEEWNFDELAKAALAKFAPTCQRCGSPLTGTNDPEIPENNRAAGYCSDVTCPHNDHLQHETWTEG